MCVAIVVAPAPRQCIDVLEHVIFGSLGVARRLLDFGTDAAHGIMRNCQVQPSGPVWICAAFQVVPQEADLVSPVGNVGFVCVEP